MFMKRKQQRIIIKLFGWIGVVFALSGFVSVIILLVYTFLKGIDEMASYWQIATNSFIIVGAIGTLLAVIVALEKEVFTKILHSPDFSVSATTVTPQSIMSPNNSLLKQKYSQHLTIVNEGESDAFDCKVDLVSIYFDKNKKGKFKPINPIAQTTQPCGNTQNIISKKSSCEFVLFEVDNPGADSNPEDHHDVQTASIRFNGITLQPKHASMGQYKIEYRVSCSEGISKNFIVEVNWEGEWSDDKEEMVEKFCTKVK